LRVRPWLAGDDVDATLGSVVSSERRARGPNKQVPWVRRPEDGVSVLRLALDTSVPVQRARVEAETGFRQTTPDRTRTRTNMAHMYDLVSSLRDNS
jgi:hypothetical protein